MIQAQNEREPPALSQNGYGASLGPGPTGPRAPDFPALDSCVPILPLWACGGRARIHAELHNKIDTNANNTETRISKLEADLLKQDVDFFV